MKPTCAVVRSLAPGADVSALSRRLDSHLGACLACQAEMARYAKLRRQLASLVDVIVPAPGPLVAAVEQAIASGDQPAKLDSTDSHPAHVAAAAGALAAAAAGAVAVAVWRHSKAPI